VQGAWLGEGNGEKRNAGGRAPVVRAPLQCDGPSVILADQPDHDAFDAQWGAAQVDHNGGKVWIGRQ